MSVAIGMDATPLLGQRSGVGNYTGRLLAALIAGNPEWTYLLYSKRPLGELEPALAPATAVAGYFPRSHWVWMQAVLPGVIARSQPDLCHFTNSLAPLFSPTPFILSIHDASLFLYRRYHPRARLFSMRLLLPWAARRAAAIITVSHSAKKDLTKALGLPAAKIHVIYEAAPKEYAPVTQPELLAALRRQYRLPEEFILYVGTLEPRKNLGRLLEAFHQARQGGWPGQLVLVGPRGWAMEGFQRRIEELKLTQAVRFLGYVPAADLPGLYSLATLFVFPSLYEGFGLPPLEAMACGVPVLTSNNSSLAEVCGPAACLVDPRDTAALAETLRRLLHDADLRAELSARGRRHTANFSWERAARETTAVYEQVLGRNGVGEAEFSRGLGDSLESP